MSILELLYVPCRGIFSAQTIGPVLLFPKPAIKENVSIDKVDISISIEVLTQKMLIKTQAIGKQGKILQVNYVVIIEVSDIAYGR